MTEETAVNQALDGYYRAFSTLSVQAILPFINKPALLLGPQGVIALPEPSAIEPIFGPVFEGLQARGYARSVLGSSEIRMLCAQSAFASGVAVRYNSDGDELERANVSYLLRKTGNVWKIAVIGLHGAPPE